MTSDSSRVVSASTNPSSTNSNIKRYIKNTRLSDINLDNEMSLDNDVNMKKSGNYLNVQKGGNHLDVPYNQVGGGSGGGANDLEYPPNLDFKYDDLGLEYAPNLDLKYDGLQSVVPDEPTKFSRKQYVANHDFDHTKVTSINSITNTFNYKSHPNAKTKPVLTRDNNPGDKSQNLSKIQEASMRNDTHNMSQSTPDWIPAELDVKWNDENHPDFSSSVKISKNPVNPPIQFEFPSQSNTMIHNKNHVKEIPIWKKLNKASQPNFHDIFLSQSDDSNNHQNNQSQNNNNSVSSTMSTPMGTMKTSQDIINKLNYEITQKNSQNPESPLKLFADNYNTYTKEKLNDVLKKVNDNRSTHQTPTELPKIHEFAKNNNNKYTNKQFIQNANQIFSHIQKKGFQRQDDYDKTANATSTPKTDKIFYNNMNDELTNSNDITSDDYTSYESNEDQNPQEVENNSDETVDDSDNKHHTEENYQPNDYTSFDENSKHNQNTDYGHSRNQSEYTFDEVSSDDQVTEPNPSQREPERKYGQNHQLSPQLERENPSPNRQQELQEASNIPKQKSLVELLELRDKIHLLEEENNRLRDDQEKFNNVSVLSIDDIHSTYPELEVKLKHASQLRLNEAKVLKTRDTNSQEIVRGRVKPDADLPNEYGNMILDEKNQRWILVQDKENTDPGSLDSIEDLEITDDYKNKMAYKANRSKNLEVSFDLRGVDRDNDVTRVSELHDVTFSQTRRRLVSVITDVLSKDNHLEDTWNHIQEIVLSGYHLDNVHDLHKLLPNLTNIDLSRNSIRYLDGLPKAILRLDLSDNDIENLTSFLQFRDLNFLNVSSNNLLNLSNISMNIHLTQLNVSNNQINSLNGIEKLVNLTKLNLSQNNLMGKIDFNKYRLENLEVLNLSENRIQAVIGLENLPLLRVLDLNENQVTNISCNGKHRSLKKLLLKLNHLKKLNLEPFPYLRVLRIDGNSLNVITDIRRLKHLQELSAKCQSNRAVVDKMVEESTNVLSLDLSGNGHFDLFGYSQRFNQISSNSFLSLTKLVLTAMNLTKIPNSFANVFPNVRELNLNFNRINNISGLADLGNIRRLYLVSNNLSKTENVIHGLTNGRSTLKVLDLRLNPCNVELYPYVFNPTELDLARRGDSPVQLETLDEIESFAIHYEALNKTIDDWEERDTEFVSKISHEKRGMLRKQYETLFINFFHNIIQLDGTMIKDQKRLEANDLLRQHSD